MNVLTRQVVAEDAGAREIVEAIEDVLSIADVHIFVRDAGNDWRPLTFGEKQAFWRLAGK